MARLERPLAGATKCHNWFVTISLRLATPSLIFNLSSNAFAYTNPHTHSSLTSNPTPSSTLSHSS